MPLAETFASWPLEARLAALFVLGAIAGAIANAAIYGFCYDPRPISPWSRNFPREGRTRWLDLLPIVGWLSPRPAGEVFAAAGRWRPLLVEFLTGVCFVVLYIWEVEELRLIMPDLEGHVRPSVKLLTLIHAQFFGHALLFVFLVAASLIDFDERTIPDEVTIPGTLAGLLLHTCVPQSQLIAHTTWQYGLTPGKSVLETILPLHLAAPRDWPAELNDAIGLAIGIGCFALWCIALLPRTWYARHGICRAIGLSVARIRRERATLWLGALAVVGSLAVGGIWSLGGERWESLLSSLVGLAAGLTLIQAIRLVGSWALGREAMGFGDAILMAMIGVYLGWQATIIAFFIAPFAAISIFVAQYLIHRDNELWFGPFLSFGAICTIAAWVPIWSWAQGTFYTPWLVPAAMAVCLVLTGLLLLILQTVRNMRSR